MRDYALLTTALQDDLKIAQDDILCSDHSLETANRLWMAKSFTKKFVPFFRPEADAECLKLFIQSNERCSSFSFDPKSCFQEQVIGEVKNFFDSLAFCGPDLNFDLSILLEGLNTGPGASIGVNSYNFYTKLFDSTLTSTSEDLFRLYRSIIRDYPRWFSAELSRFQHHGNRIVEGNRLSFVPKTTEISRSICTEPNLNMFFQKGLGFFLETQLSKRFKIDLSRQPDLNRRLAQQGSADGSFGTIDLSSASDSMSLRLIKEIMPPELFRWFDLARSPYVTFPDGTRSELHMISSMGNAFTFPLQTILFSSIVVACYRVLGIKPKFDKLGPSNFGVFGDDIIVRKDAYNFVVDCLGLFGFVVNVSKSFNTGYFRESCGGDFFKGTDIRGVYVKSLSTSADVYSAINRVVRWSTRTGVFLFRTVEVLRGYLGQNVLCIPYKDGDSEGIKTPYPAGPRIGFDSNTQSISYFAMVVKPSSFRVPLDETQSYLYPRRKGKKRVKILFNPDGLICSFLAGFIRDERVSIRNDVNRFKVRRRTTSSWSGVSIPPDASLVVDPKGKTLSLHLSANAAGFECREREWKISFAQYLNVLFLDKR